MTKVQTLITPCDYGLCHLELYFLVQRTYNIQHLLINFSVVFEAKYYILKANHCFFDTFWVHQIIAVQRRYQCYKHVQKRITFC